MLGAWLWLAACSPPNEGEPAGVPVAVRLNPNGPLSPFVVVDAPVDAEVVVEVVGPDGATFERAAAWDGTHHVAWIWGLSAEADYEVTARVDGAAWAPIPLQTEPLPFAPPVATVVVDEAGRDEGLTLIVSHIDGEVLGTGYDPAGNVVWYYDAGPIEQLGTASLRLLPDGNLAMFLDGEIRVITPDGQTVSSRRVPYTHDAILRPDGHLLYVTDRIETYEVAVLGETHDVLVDGVIEVDADGKKVAEWWASDDLDIQRFDSALSKTNEMGNASLDWGHANALVERDDGLLLLSLRHQSWIVALDWTTQRTRWVLGEDGDFSIDDPKDWFNSQHSPEPMPDGSILIYDNGVERSPPYTRVMRMALDETGRKADLMWSFRLDVFTAHAGDVDPLPDGNVLVTAGEPSNLREPPRVFEATADAEVLWQMEVAGPPIFRATRIPGF